VEKIESGTSPLLNIIIVVVVRLLRMHEMQSVAVDVPVCQSVCLYHTPSIRFGVRKQLSRLRFCLGPKEHCVIWGFRFPHSEGVDKHIRCSLCQITLASCY